MEEQATPTPTPTTPTNEAAPAPLANEAAPAPVVNEAAAPVVNEAGPTDDYSADLPDQVKDFGKANKLSAAQLQATVDLLQNALETSKGADQTVLQEAGQAHIKNWGAQAGTYMSVAKRALKQSDPEGKLTTLLKDTGFANHPTVLEFFKDLGMNLQEGGFLKGAVNVPPGERTLAQTMYGDKHPSKQ